MPDRTYRPAWWLPGPHLPTLWGKFFRHAPPVATRHERWETPDGDFVDVERLDAPAANRPRIVLLHGLEGSPRSHYVRGLFAEAHARGWAMDLLVFRSCGNEANRTRRFYHSGETGDLAFVLDRVLAESASDHDAPVFLAGVSLGGNVLLKFLGERGDHLPPRVTAAAAISVPFDLERGSRHISRGFARVYERHFLRTLRRKALAKLERFPDLADRGRLADARTLFDFDDVVTAPVHGFASATDYYTRSSSLRWLDRVALPTLLLSAEDDPFLPRDVLDQVRAVARHNPALVTEFVARGGHVGFVAGTLPWRPTYYAERRVCDFFAARLAAPFAGPPERAESMPRAAASASTTPTRRRASGFLAIAALAASAATLSPAACARPATSHAASPPVETPELPVVSDPHVADSLLADVRTADSTIVVALRYATSDNFTGAPLPGYEGNRAFLRREAAAALGRVQRRLAAQGLSLKVWDAYRPVRATLAMVDWTRRVSRDDLLRDGYIASRSRHNLGLAIDLTLVDRATGRELDMGTPFDTFSAAAHTANATGTAAANRRRLQTVMEREGFANYDQEWWHYTYALPDPVRFDVVIR